MAADPADACEASDEALGQVLWDYHRLGRPPQHTDCLMALGGPDVRVAQRAAELFHQGYAERLVCTGGVAHQDDLLATGWEKAEAKVFAEVAVAAGVPSDRILVESQATNTGENIRFSRRLLEVRGVVVQSALLVVKPHMERRAVATAGVAWPGAVVHAASQEVAFADYPTPEIRRETVIQLMVGDLQRIWLYGTAGYQVPQVVPRDVLAAFHELVRRGYDDHCVPGAAMAP